MPAFSPERDIIILDSNQSVLPLEGDGISVF